MKHCKVLKVICFWWMMWKKKKDVQAKIIFEQYRRSLNTLLKK